MDYSLHLGFGRISFALALLLMAGCARVTVRKVPTPTQYTEWSDRMQAKADRMDGIRFYLPRPFVNVFESFPVRTDVYLVNGVVTPDNQGVIIRDVRPGSPLANLFASGTNQITIPRTVIAPASEQSVQATIATQSAILSALAEPVKPALAPTNNVVTSGANPTPKTESTSQGAGDPAPGIPARTGINERNIANDNGAYAYQPMRGNLDLAYLPDFEEQYAVDSHSGLGNAKFSLNLGQGWSLQSLNSLSDNSEINKRIFDIIDSSVELAKAAAKASMGIPPIPGIPTDAVITPQSSALKDEPAGTPVTLKIVVVHYAAKGLYPIIKPRELQERQTGRAITNRFLYLNLHKLLDAQPSPVSAFDPQAIARAQKAVDNETGNFTVPRYPYQYLSFQTFRYLAIQVVRPGDKPFDALYDKTGTQGSAGEAQRADLASFIYDGLTRNAAKHDKDAAKGAGKLNENERGLWMQEITKTKYLPKVPGCENGKGCYAVDKAIYDIDSRVLTATLAHTGVPVLMGTNRLEELVDDLARDAYRRVRDSMSKTAPSETPLDKVVLQFSTDLGKLLTADTAGAVSAQLSQLSYSSGTNAVIKATLDKVVTEEPLKITVKLETSGSVEKKYTRAELQDAIGKDLEKALQKPSKVVVEISNATDALGFLK